MGKEGLNLTQSKVDTCMHHKKKDGALKAILIIHVDNCLILGPKEEIKILKEKLRLEFGTVKQGQLMKLLGVNYDWKRDENGEPYAIMPMYDKAKEIVHSYKEQVKKMPRSRNMLGMSGMNLKNNVEELVNITGYRSIIGTIIFYGTKITPEVAFTCGKLARYMHNPGNKCKETLITLVGYIKAKEKHELILRNLKDLITVMFVNSSYKDCKDTKKSRWDRYTQLEDVS